MYPSEVGKCREKQVVIEFPKVRTSFEAGCDEVVRKEAKVTAKFDYLQPFPMPFPQTGQSSIEAWDGVVNDDVG
jgi:hypothetical protein